MKSKTLALGLTPTEEFVLQQFLEEGILNSYIGREDLGSKIYTEFLRVLENENLKYYRDLSLESQKRINKIESGWFWDFYRRLDRENGGPADYDRPPLIVGCYW